MKITLHRSRAEARAVTSRHDRHDESRGNGAALLRHLGAGLLRIGAATLQTMPTRAGDATSALQVLPDSTLRGLAAASAGLGAGFFVTGVPRVVVVGALVPGLAAVAAIASRPVRPAVRIQLLPPAAHGR